MAMNTPPRIFFTRDKGGGGLLFTELFQTLVQEKGGYTQYALQT